MLTALLPFELCFFYSHSACIFFFLLLWSFQPKKPSASTPHAAVPTEISLRNHVTGQRCPNQLGLFHESVWLKWKTGGHWETVWSITDNQPIGWGPVLSPRWSGDASQMRGETFQTIESQDRLPLEGDSQLSYIIARSFLLGPGQDIFYHCELPCCWTPAMPNVTWGKRETCSFTKNLLCSMLVVSPLYIQCSLDCSCGVQSSSGYASNHLFGLM